MKKVTKLAGIIVLITVILFSMIACNKKADIGELTITGLDDYNGKYLYGIAYPDPGQAGNVQLWAVNSIEMENLDITLSKINGGSVTTKVWKSLWLSSEESYTVGVYNGNDTVTFNVSVFSEEKGFLNRGDFITVTEGEITATFQNGVAGAVFKNNPDWDVEYEMSGPQDSPPNIVSEDWAQIGADIITVDAMAVTAGVTADGEGRIAVSYPNTKIKEWSALLDTPFPKRKNYFIGHIAYGNSRFVASGFQFTGQDSPPSGFMMAYSVDGISWTQANCPLPDNTQIDGIAYGNGKFVMIGRSFQAFPDGSGYDIFGYIAVSTDGENWTQTVKPFNTRWSSVTFISDKESFFRIVEQKLGWEEGSPRTAISIDGENWTME